MALEPSQPEMAQPNQPPAASAAQTQSETTIYTIGHSSHPIDKFIELLKQHDITLVVDVRSAPHSRYNPQFNREVLAAALANEGIKYLFLGKELGARPQDPNCYKEGRVDFGQLAGRPEFKTGLERVRAEAKTCRLAVMCAEKDPLDCHRTILVCRHLRASVGIKHILADGSIEDHAQTEARLRGAFSRSSRNTRASLEGGRQTKTSPKATPSEPTLFDYAGNDSTDLAQASVRPNDSADLEQAYDWRAAKIAYKPETEQPTHERG